MRARTVLLVGLGLSLNGCLLPTPYSAVSMGVDTVSFVATGKAATDHGLSLAMGEDCALIRIFDGQICQTPRVYEATQAGVPLEPLPDSIDSAQLAAAHPEVRAAIERAAQYDGWASDNIQFALLPSEFVADDFDSITAPLPVEAEAEPAELSFGDLFSSISAELAVSGSAGYREPANRADGGRMDEQPRTPASSDLQQASLSTLFRPSSPSRGASREVGLRPDVAPYGKAANGDAAWLADRLPSLRNREIGG